jgi:pimeloyl-ACP methyl ester carboxylesterase/O-succinylbenzoate synthase
LRCPEVHKNMKPDLVLQFGAPLISTEIHKVIKETMSDRLLHHVLVHSHHDSERADPEFTVSHRVNADVGCFLRQLTDLIHTQNQGLPGSQLAPLVSLGRILQSEMPELVDQVATKLRGEDPKFTEMTEPQIVMSLSKIFTGTAAPDLSLFLSNSMPVRDAEAFLYPTSSADTSEYTRSALKDTGVNRGASGIDGVIASAAGFADSTSRPTTLLIGDVAALHDINSLHALRTATPAQEVQSQKNHPLTTIVLNNDGGGIFSFLPIAKYGADVGFDDFFGTPTDSFSFEKGASAFDIPFRRVESIESFIAAYTSSLSIHKPSMIEAVVASRGQNVVVHKEITARVNKFVSNVLSSSSSKSTTHAILPLKHKRAGKASESRGWGKKTLVLLHGWMGDSSDWEEVEAQLLQSLPSEWSILSLDLPGHGLSSLTFSSEVRSISNALDLEDSRENSENQGFALDDMARAVCRTLEEFGVKSIDALAGYSLGGRVALAMKRLSMLSSKVDTFNRCNIVKEDTKMILLSAYPGEILGNRFRSGRDLEADKLRRMANDEKLAREIEAVANRQKLIADLPERAPMLWANFLNRWYKAPLWGLISKDSKLYNRMVERRAQVLSYRGHDLAAVLSQCSPSKCSNEDWRGAVPENTMFMAGELDRKYCDIGREWYDVEPSLLYFEVPGKGHALLVEAAVEVAEATAAFLLRNEDEAQQIGLQDDKIWNTRFIPSVRRDRVDSNVRRIDTHFTGLIGSLDFEAFKLDIGSKRGQTEGVFGVGWGEESKARENDSLRQRSGFVIQLTSKDGLRVGVGEVSPLNGLHFESVEESGVQLEQIAGRFADFDPDFFPTFDARQVLALDGAMALYLESVLVLLKMEKFHPSVRAGLEMCILSLASQIVRSPIHEALVANAPQVYTVRRVTSVVPLNGLVTRNPDSRPRSPSFLEGKPSYASWKVKIAHQSSAKDADTIRSILQSSTSICKVRADANRGFGDELSFMNYTETLRVLDARILEQLEYIEEPLSRALHASGSWSLENQVQALERCFNKTSIPYALDESLYDLMELHRYSFDEAVADLKQVFRESPRGCAAFVLKPSLLGLEASMRLARLARTEFGIGAVFSSSFDSGVGLAYYSFLGSLSDATPAKGGVQQYPHGLSTFDEMTSDCLSPSFGSYVNDQGMLNVCSLSRAFYGLALDEIQSLSPASLPPPLPVLEKVSIGSVDLAETTSSYATPINSEPLDFPPEDFEASTSTSNSGRDIVLVASLPLPFSAEIACSRFTDLPQQPRWSPWLASVAYLDAASETEWTLRVRGVSFRWRAKSEFLDAPFKGIRWKSISGVKTTGVVEFIPTSPAVTRGNGAVVETCIMKVRMAFVTPRLLSSLFRGTIVEDFLRNKIMKWSLEMFRDVVKGDLALEEGNVELGDALFGAVEGKASAIEATLASSSSASSTSTSTPPFFDHD